jgi:hypothetical protein
LLGFCCRATHNLWVLLEEEKWLAEHIANGSYVQNFEHRVDNSIYKPLIEAVVNSLN